MAADKNSPDPGAVSPQTADAGGFFDRPDYESPAGMKAELPGEASDAGSQGPSATTVSGSISNAAAQMAEMASDTTSGLGGSIGDAINLPGVDSADVWPGGGAADSGPGVGQDVREVGPVSYLSEMTAGDQHNVWPSAPTALPEVDSGDVWHGY